MTTFGLPHTLNYATVELASCLVTPSARAYGSEGWGFESLRARPAQRCFPALQVEVAKLVVFAAGSFVGLELDTDQVWAGNGHRPARMRLVYGGVFDVECGEVLNPALQLGVARDG